MELKKIDLSKFENLETKGELLKGGFSSVIVMSTSQMGGLATDPTNQCTISNKGNCVAGCAGTINRFICGVGF